MKLKTICICSAFLLGTTSSLYAKPTMESDAVEAAAASEKLSITFASFSGGG
ncbi:hypothetical protein OAB00_01860 [Akkermansiaceae bacterium]|nr:hypothetical protein [Akkermansiaceae bacterium]